MMDTEGFYDTEKMYFAGLLPPEMEATHIPPQDTVVATDEVDQPYTGQTEEPVVE